MRRIKAQEGQSLFDIAIQECGMVEAAYDIAQKNDLEITQVLSVGQHILIPYTLSVNKDILQYYKQRNITPSTSYFSSDIAAIIEEGDICYGGPFSEEFSDPYDRNECADYEGTPIIAYDPVFSEEF